MDNHHINCPRCDSLLYTGESAPTLGSVIDCKSCGFTLRVKNDDEKLTDLPPKRPEPIDESKEKALETLSPMEDLPSAAPTEPAAPPKPTAPAAPAAAEPTVKKPAPLDLSDYEELDIKTLEPIAESSAKGEVAVRRPVKTTRETFKFSGKAGEYFKIWIVNIALTIITLGIYSAWAKVRNNRYFYGNTTLLGSSFEYHADPIKILIGRIIVFLIFVIYQLANHFVPVAGGLIYIALIFIVPWFVIKSMKFRARNSSYRGIHFNFEADYGEALATFVGYALIASVTLGIGYPHFVYKRKEFAISHSRYGTTPFMFTTRSWNYYKIYIKAFLMMLLLIGIPIGLAVAIPMIVASKGASGFSANTGAILAILPMIFMAVFYLIIFTYLKTAVENLSLSSASIGESHLESTMRIRDMAWIYVSNAFLIIVTLGLMTPWAKIRSKRYKIEHLHLHVGEDFDAFIADEAKVPSTFGEEAIDFLDFDIGL